MRLDDERELAWDEVRSSAKLVAIAAAILIGDTLHALRVSLARRRIPDRAAQEDAV